MTCPSCGPVEPLLSWSLMSDGRRHIKARCPRCHRFLCWAEQTPANVQAADATKLSRPQQGGLFG